MVYARDRHSGQEYRGRSVESMARTAYGRRAVAKYSDYSGTVRLYTIMYPNRLQPAVFDVLAEWAVHKD